MDCGRAGRLTDKAKMAWVAGWRKKQLFNFFSSSYTLYIMEIIDVDRQFLRFYKCIHIGMK